MFVIKTAIFEKSVCKTVDLGSNPGAALRASVFSGLDGKPDRIMNVVHTQQI